MLRFGVRGRTSVSPIFFGYRAYPDLASTLALQVYSTVNEGKYGDCAYLGTKATKEDKQPKIRSHDIWVGNISASLNPAFSLKSLLLPSFFTSSKLLQILQATFFYTASWPAIGAKGCLTAWPLQQHVCAAKICYCNKYPKPLEIVVKVWYLQLSNTQSPLPGLYGWCCSCCMTYETAEDLGESGLL